MLKTCASNMYAEKNIYMFKDIAGYLSWYDFLLLLLFAFNWKFFCPIIQGELDWKKKISQFETEWYE